MSLFLMKCKRKKIQKVSEKIQKQKGELFSYVKKFDGSFLPPCHTSVGQKIKRTNYVAAKWLSSTDESMPEIL